ncbi:uncharacterized protein LOC126790970 [Argentina anserina]|uniref:uncharacterized protein LOC126790970 n=1 Tax=Argentina anserina TaxID=57926 RepID=UPI0021764715|nr:uncharacterized protein LOC126790970 [Potentilla anserina]
MLDQYQKFPRNQLYVTCHVHSRHESAEDKEFGFRSAWEFQAQACLEEDLGVHSPRLWETNTKYESSPLLPQNHHYSDLSPTSRRRVILEGRNELMQTIQDMPESCYELSLRDIVDEEQQGMQKAGKGTDVEEKSFDFNAQARIRNQKKITAYKTRQISRTSSMESETFLIKMFFPTFLGLKKKAKAAGNCSKVSPRPTFGPENHEDFCVESTSSRRRFSDDDILPGCWTFFHSKKGKSKRPRGS